MDNPIAGAPAAFVLPEGTYFCVPCARPVLIDGAVDHALYHIEELKHLHDLEAEFIIEDILDAEEIG